MLTWGGVGQKGRAVEARYGRHQTIVPQPLPFQTGGWARERGGEAGPNAPQKNFLKVREGSVKVP